MTPSLGVEDVSGAFPGSALTARRDEYAGTFEMFGWLVWMSVPSQWRLKKICAMMLRQLSFWQAAAQAAHQQKGQANAWVQKE